MNICNHPAGERVVFVWVAPHFPLKYCMNIIMCLAPFGIHIWIHTTVSKCTTVQLYTQRWFNEGLCFSMWLGPFYISHAYTRLVPSYNGEYTSMTAWWICHAAYYIRWVYAVRRWRRWPDGYAMLLISLGGYMLYEATVVHVHKTAVYILGLQHEFTSTNSTASEFVRPIWS